MKINWEEFKELSPSLEEMVPRIRILKKWDKSYVKSLEEVLARARAFSRREIYPRALEIDEKVTLEPRYFDWEIVNKGVLDGWLSFAVPREVGGQGYLGTGMSIVMEEMCAGCAGIANIFGAHALGFCAIALSMDMDVVDRYLGTIVKKEREGEPWLFSLDITEPSAGSDVEDAPSLKTARLTLEAKKVSGGYILNGRKCFISNGSVARAHFVTAALDRKNPLESFTAFAVPATAKGVSVGRVERKMGQKACPASEVIFEDVFVPEVDRLGKEGEGMFHTMTILTASRGPVGAIATGIARGAFERAYVYASTHKRNGKYLIENDWVKDMLSEMMIKIHMARQAVFDSCMYFDFFHIPLMLKKLSSRIMGRFFPYPMRRAFSRFINWDFFYDLFHNRILEEVPLPARSRGVRYSSLAKVAGSDVAMECSEMAMKILGEDALIRDFGVEKCYRDAKLTQIYEGTNQINRMALFKDFKKPGTSEGAIS